MRAKILAGAMVTLLVAAAFFLPELLLAWGDSQSLDILHMESQDEEREGFAESIQLTVPEKILLLRSGKLTGMELDRFPADETEDGDARETALLWKERAASACGEIRALQTLGGLPEVWTADNPPEYAGSGDLLYLDPETHMSFQVYQLSLRWGTHSMDLLVDQQSQRILSFTLQWSRGGGPNWGPRGASLFGSAWRDYWRMDSVSTGWYNEYTRNILENVEIQAVNGGDYTAHDQITFMYDSQSLAVPLDCQGAWPRNCFIAWNR